MKKTVLFIVMILLLTASVCYAEEASCIHPFTFANVAEFGMSYDELTGKFRDYYEAYDCSHRVDSVSDVMTCQQDFEQQSHTSTYVFVNDQLIAEVCTTVVRVEGFRKEDAFEQYAGAYDLSPYENCDNDVLDQFVEEMYTDTSYYTRAGNYTYMIMGGSDETDTDWPQVFIGFFSRDYIDSLTQPEGSSDKPMKSSKGVPWSVSFGTRCPKSEKVSLKNFDLLIPGKNMVSVDRP